MPNTFRVQLRSIDSIKPYDRNPRINDQAVDAVAASLKEFGFQQPIVVDADGVIVAGHTRSRWRLRIGARDSQAVVVGTNVREGSAVVCCVRAAGAGISS